MPLQDVDVTIDDNSLPDDVETLIRVADSRVTRFLENENLSQASGFVPSDPALVFRTLRGLDEGNFLKGNSFCEWGSGFGTATCVAANLGLEAFGIEIEPELVNAARTLANDFALPAEFVQGSFVPSPRRGISEEAFEDNIGRYPWLRNDADDAYQKLGRQLDSFDVVFVYPWPGEEYFVEQLFNTSAAQDAVLLIYSDCSSLRVRRKKIGRVDKCGPSYDGVSSESDPAVYKAR